MGMTTTTALAVVVVCVLHALLEAR